MKKLAWLAWVLVSIQALAFQSAAQIIRGTYAIQNVQTGLVLRIQDAHTQNGTPLVAYTPTNWKCMTWDFQHLDGNTYQLRNLFSSKTFQPQLVPEVPVKLEEQPLQPGSPQQKWEFIPVSDNTYRIKLADKDLYVTPADEKGTINSRIILRPKMEGQLQCWTLHEQHPTS